MAGFTVAGFDFGKNIENNRIRREQIAASAAASARSAALQARGQDIQKQEHDDRMAAAEAARADAAAQREAELAERGAAREESARQFNERMAREDQKREDELADKKHKQSWDDALKQQQIEAEDMKYQKWQADLEELLAKGRRDQEEYEAKVQAQKELRESALGMVSEGVLLSGPMGGFTPSQVQHFNEKFGQQFDAIGRRDMTTGKQYEDGLIHLIQYAKDDKGNILYGFQDENGNTVEDPQRKNPNSQPLVVQDQSISKDDYEFGLGRLREYGGRALKGGGSGLEIAKINAEQKEKDRAAKTAKSDREMDFKERKFEYGVSKDMAKEAKDFFSAIGSDADKEAFKKKYPELAKSILGIAQSGDGETQPAQTQEQPKYGTAQKDGEYWVRTTKDGRKFRIKDGDDPNVRSNWSQF